MLGLVGLHYVFSKQGERNILFAEPTLVLRISRKVLKETLLLLFYIPQLQSRSGLVFLLPTRCAYVFILRG